MKYRTFSLVALLAVMLAWPAQAQIGPRPASTELLPDNTVAFVQLPNVVQAMRDLDQTGFGQLLRDEKVSPLVNQLYDEVVTAYESVQDQVGASWDELRTLATGEITFAVVAPRRDDPAIVIIMDVNQETEAVQKLLTRGRQLATDEGATIDEKDEQGFNVQVIHNGDTEIAYVLHEGTFLATNNPTVLTDILLRWIGQPPEKDQTLAQNRKFITIMNRCRGTQDQVPTLAFYVDPIDLAKAVTRGDMGARAAMGFLPLLGLDGLLGIGGTSIYNDQGYESVVHLHVLLASPKAGVFEMLALKPGDLTPEEWVPADAVSYLSVNVNVEKMYTEFEKIFNGFAGEGKLAEEIQSNINDELEIDFRQDVIGLLDGRVTLMTWLEPPIRFNSQTTAVGVQIIDAEKAEQLIDKILAKTQEEGSDWVEKRTFRGVTMWTATGPERQREQRDQDEDDGEVDVDIRTPTPTLALIGDYAVASDSRGCIEHLIETYQDEHPNLSGDEDFQTSAQEMTRLLGTQAPAAMIYSQPEENIRLLLDLAKSDNTRALLSRGAEENEYVRRLKQALEDNPLPNPEDLAKYFAPSGGFMTSDDTGYHFLMFQTKPESSSSR
jgi:hypothetical protein